MSLREEILDVSKELLIKNGFGNISMRKIAKRLDVTATSIYLYFKNKDELLLSLIEESINDLNRSLKNSLVDGDDPVEQFESIINAYIGYALNHPQEYEIIYMVRAEEMPKYPKEKFEQIRDTYEILEKVIREGKEKELFEVDNPLISAYSIWAQTHGIVSVVLNKRLDTRIPTQQFINQAVEHLVQGFLVQKTPA